MIDKQKYREFCKKEKSLPIFSKDWWLDAVCGEDNWSVVLIENDNGEIIASLPYYKEKEYGFNTIKMPEFTQNFRLLIKYPKGQKYGKRLSYEEKIITEIIERLPKYDRFNLNFYYSLTNWLPFYWKGFKQTTRYTYVIEDLSDLNKVFNSFSRSKRENIRRAEEIVKVFTDLPAKDFYENHRLTLKKQNNEISYSFSIFENIYNNVYMHDSGKVFYAIDGKNNLHAALLIIWDDIQAYGLINTIDPDYRNSGAAALVTKEVIKYISTRTKKFDFEGSMIKGVENSYRQFGTIQKSFFNISKINSKVLQLAIWVRKVIGK